MPPFIIAELSANHMGDINRAKLMIKAAKDAGADAVKLQTYNPDKITIDSDNDEFIIKGGPWEGRTLHDLYCEAQTPKEWHRPLFDYANELDIIIFSSPFDLEAIDFLENLNCPAYKIASFELVDIPLIQKAAQTGKPLIMSTGLAREEEIQDAINAALSAGATDIVLLQCISAYPAPPEESNLVTMTDMATRFNIMTGLSDHTLTETVPIAAAALGARVIEKHFTLSRSDGGADADFSLEPDEFARMVTAVKTAHSAIGTITYGPTNAEGEGAKYRRSLYFARDLEAGHIITADDIVSIRPGLGLMPKYFPDVIGKTIKPNIKRGTPVSWEHFEINGEYKDEK
jgi:N-acetylneuraminate synthase